MFNHNPVVREGKRYIKKMLLKNIINSGLIARGVLGSKPACFRDNNTWSLSTYTNKLEIERRFWIL
jgi:hypothetical protein